MAGKQILIIANADKAGVTAQVEALQPWLAQRGHAVEVADVRQGGPVPRADLCIVFGGDGTLLAAARQVAPAGIPMIGVNMGKLGFLAEFNVEHMKRHLDEVLAGKIAPTERMMLRADAGDGEAFCSLAANDVAIAAGAPFRMIELTVGQGDEEIATYLADGVVVATPTGSTGYNLSADGPILDPTLEAVVITPVAAHSLSMRPIVVRPDAPIRITANRVNPGTTLVIDGQDCAGLTEGQTVIVRRAECNARIIPHPGRTFFGTLTRKLQWGLSPHHDGSA